MLRHETCLKVVQTLINDGKLGVRSVGTIQGGMESVIGDLETVKIEDFSGPNVVLLSN